MCELLVGLGEVDVVGVEACEPLVLHVWTRRRARGEGCGARVWSKGVRPMRLVDLTVFGHAVRLVRQASLVLPSV